MRGSGATGAVSGYYNETMALRLTVISDHREQLGANGSIVLGVGGGNIGRARDNDWSLPDPMRYLSSHHARIQFRRGNFYLEDTSTNGVFVNESEQALSRRGPHQLSDGDVLRMGPYILRVSLDGSGESEAEASSVYPVETEPMDHASTGVELEVDELFFVPAAATRDAGLAHFDKAQRQATANSRVLAGPPAEPSVPVPAPTALPTPNRQSLQAAAGAEGRVASGAAAFCRGAGIDPLQFPAESNVRLLYLAGLLLREALVGLKGLSLTRYEIQSSYHLEGMNGATESRPALRTAAIEDLLIQLLMGHEKHEIDALLWLREKLGNARRHEEAMQRALQIALAEFTSRLDPNELSIGADQQQQVNSVISIDNALSNRFRSITERTSGGLPHLFAESFSRVYLEEYRRAERKS